MNRNKCARCGLVNSDADENCRRCGTSLSQQADAGDQLKPKRTILRRLAWMLSATAILIIAWYISLLVTSEGLSADRTKVVMDAISVLEQGGFSRETFILRNVAAYRQTDNWWNHLVGHHDAYAATNFPFEVVTLYPQFFDKTVDDNERAAILLHEAFHLFGSSEDAALLQTWQNKKRIGWTEQKYGRVSEAWNNTRQLTSSRFPQLFTCGTNEQSDCF